MSVTNVVFVWLTVLTFMQFVFGAVAWYLFKSGDDTRLEAMRLRARLNSVTDQGNKLRLKKSVITPPTKKVEIDLTQMEYVDDELNP
jgi:hypothetical protein